MKLAQKIAGLASGEGRLAVIGLGISGVAVAQLFAKSGIDVVCIERQPAEKFSESKFAAQVQALEKAGVEIRLGVDGEAAIPFLEDVRLAVLSPGVSLESAIAGVLGRLRIEIVSELELGIELTGAPTLVVTGSNGKTTTSTLLHAILKDGAIDARLCGNVGTPVVTELSPAEIRQGVSSAGNRVLVVEASSYQLEACTVLKPRVGIFLNLSDNHLERHGSMERYLAAKARLFVLQEPNDLAVINTDDPFGRRLLEHLKVPVAAVGAKSHEIPRRLNSGWSARIDYNPAGSRDLIELETPGGKERYELQRAKLLGRHNRYDIASALIAARWWGVSQASALATIEGFLPLEHRLEIVTMPATEPSAPVYINDSKSTTVAASVAALETVVERYPQQRVTLMLGGLAKAGSWEPLLKSLDQHRDQVAILCFGRDARIISNHCREADLTFEVATHLKAAVSRVKASAGPGDVILFSPACASFDEFTDFEHRGSVFKSLVRE